MLTKQIETTLHIVGRHIQFVEKITMRKAPDNLCRLGPETFFKHETASCGPYCQKSSECKKCFFNAGTIARSLLGIPDLLNEVNNSSHLLRTETDYQMRSGFSPERKFIC